MPRQLSLAAIQMEVLPGPDGLDRLADRLEAVGRDFPGLDLILGSELCLFGPDMKWAQPVPGPATERLCGLARRLGKWLVPGSLHEQTPEGVYNTALVINPQGEMVARYRKVFPWRPHETCLAGREFRVFDIPGRARLGLCICYDQWFPEVVRQLVWLGAEVILHPVMTTTPDRPLELILSQAHAIANQVYFVSANGLGRGGNGRSLIVDPEGRTLKQAGEEEAILVERLDLDLVKRVREKGTLGLCQVLKSFGGSGIEFPVYGQGPSAGEGFKGLGPLDLPKKRH